jgi:hypothetical protein
MSFSNPNADDCRQRADWHSRKAAQLKSGDHKDSHLIAEKKFRTAADLSDKAERAGQAAELLESAVVNGDSAVNLVRQLKALNFSESEILKLTERDEAKTKGTEYWQD